MAEVQRKIITNKTGIRKSKKHSTRVDLTPMVDLGFLLITFFVFTTSLSTPTAMRLILPKDTKDSSFTAANKTISLLLTGSNTIYYYNGDSVNNMHVPLQQMKYAIFFNRKKQECNNSITMRERWWL